MTIEEIVNKYREWKEGKDSDWVYDETYDFVEQLSRGEILRIMQTLESLYPVEESD